MGLRSAGVLAAISVLIFQGCAGRVTEISPGAERLVCVSEKVSVGARLPVNVSSPMGTWTEPELFIVTALAGRSDKCMTDYRRPILAWVVPESRHKALEEQARVQREQARMQFSNVGTVAAGDVFPAGALLLAAHTYRKVGADEGAAWLVVNYSAPGPKGERSYVADTTVRCGTGSLSVAWTTTFRQANGGGEAVSSETHSPTLNIDKPSPALAAAARAICALGAS